MAPNLDIAVYDCQVLRYDETRYQLLEQEMLHKKQPDGSKLIHKFQEVNDVFLYFDKVMESIASF